MNKVIGLGILGVAIYVLYEWYQNNMASQLPVSVPSGGPQATNAIPATNVTGVQNYPLTSSPGISVNPPTITNATSVGTNSIPVSVPANTSGINANTQGATVDLATLLTMVVNGQVNGIDGADGYLNADGTMDPDHWSYYLSKVGLTLSPQQFGMLYDRTKLYTAQQFVAQLKTAGLAGLGRLYVSGYGGMGMGNIGMGLGVIGRGYGINTLSPRGATWYEAVPKYIM